MLSPHAQLALTAKGRAELRERIDQERRAQLRRQGRVDGRCARLRLVGIARCEATTGIFSSVPGSRCSFMARPGSRFCGIHARVQDVAA